MIGKYEWLYSFFILVYFNQKLIQLNGNQKEKNLKKSFDDKISNLKSITKKYVKKIWSNTGRS